MKRSVVIPILLVSIAGSLFMLKQTTDFEDKYIAYAADNVTAKYNSGILTINDLEGKARVIQASYDENGILTAVKLNDAQNGENEIPTRVGFLPWGINWDTTLTWLIDSGCKTEHEVIYDSTSWGNYSNNTFADYRGYAATGQWEETEANNIYDLAGNYWEWTQERTSVGGYAVRAGGYNIMGGPCPGDRYPVVIRSNPSVNDQHPNITFRVALYLN